MIYYIYEHIEKLSIAMFILYCGIVPIIYISNDHQYFDFYFYEKNTKFSINNEDIERLHSKDETIPPLFAKNGLPSLSELLENNLKTNKTIIGESVTLQSDSKAIDIEKSGKTSESKELSENSPSFKNNKIPTPMSFMSERPINKVEPDTLQSDRRIIVRKKSGKTSESKELSENSPSPKSTPEEPKFMSTGSMPLLH